VAKKIAEVSAKSPEPLGPSKPNLLDAMAKQLAAEALKAAQQEAMRKAVVQIIPPQPTPRQPSPSLSKDTALSVDMKHIPDILSSVFSEPESTFQLESTNQEIEATYEEPQALAKQIAVDNDVDKYLRALEANIDPSFSIYMIWHFALNLINNEDYNKAFELLLRAGDDLMLMRG
jgi:hypothetical protein